jgi:hypothetical protein
MYRSLSILIHGGAKVGKTTLAETAPGPRLVLDAEGGSRFTASRKVLWDPTQYAPPVDDGSWDTCVVYVRDFDTVQRVYQWLASGQHPFRSVVLDSISEIQQRCIDALVGTDPMMQQDWGDLLRRMSDLVRKMRDLTIHPTNPLEAVVLIAMTREVNGKWKAYMQGQIATTLPYYIDVIGYLFTEMDTTTGAITRQLLTAPLPSFDAGDRTGRLPDRIPNPNLSSMLDTIFGPRAVTAPVAAETATDNQQGDTDV